MVTRGIAASVLVLAALVAWVTITTPVAARLLQLSILGSVGYVVWLAWRGGRIIRRAHREAQSGASIATGRARRLPFVSIVVPARNEASVIAATVANLRELRYAGDDGAPAYEVVVVDDASTDGTADRARAAAAGATHVRVHRREAGAGPQTKGAVLADATGYLRGDIVGVVDADARVDAAFLERAMRAWRNDDAADALQVTRRPWNAADSWLADAQAVEHLMDMASQCGRWSTDGTAELRGNGMFIRREALEAVGGWNPRALTEDLDISTRLSAAGRHVVLAPAVVVEEEALERIRPLWRQRMRWAEGSIRRLIEYGPGLLAGGQSLARKIDFLAFTAEFIVPPLFATTIVASLVTIPMPQPADWTVPLSLFAAYGLGVFVLAAAGLLGGGEGVLGALRRATVGSLFLSHWLLVVPIALLRIAAGPEPTTFAQTPRFRGEEVPR